MGKLAAVSVSDASNSHQQETRDVRPPFKRRDEMTSGRLAEQ